MTRKQFGASDDDVIEGRKQSLIEESGEASILKRHHHYISIWSTMSWRSIIFTFWLLCFSPIYSVKPSPNLIGKRNSSQKVGTSEPSPISAIQKSYDWYLDQCTSRPFVTKSITAACIASAGDLMSQSLEAHVAKETFALNPVRLKTFFLCGLLYVGPFIHRYYELLATFARWLHTKYSATNRQQILGQLFLDQTLGVAIFFPLYFYVYEFFEAIVRQSPPSFARAHAKCLEQIKGVVLMQYRVYPLANLINFGYVPEQLRVLYSNTVGVLWNIYLCAVIS